MQVRAFERKIYPLNDVQTKGKEEIFFINSATVFFDQKM